MVKSGPPKFNYIVKILPRENAAKKDKYETDQIFAMLITKNKLV